MSLKHAILGFLSYASLSGYDLKKAFDRSVRHFWPADQSQIYRTLSQLSKQGLVEQEVIPREGRLDLKRYHITKAGQGELEQWLSVPLPDQDTREPFLVQVFFGGKLTDEQVLLVLERERQRIEERLKTYAQVYEQSVAQPSVQESPRENFYGLLTLEFGLLSGRSYLTWLDGAIDRARKGDYTPQDLQALMGNNGGCASEECS